MINLSGPADRTESRLGMMAGDELFGLSANVRTAPIGTSQLYVT